MNGRYGLDTCVAQGLLHEFVTRVFRNQMHIRHRREFVDLRRLLQPILG